MRDEVLPLISDWIQATRPRVFTASYVPLMLAGVIAADQGELDLGILLLSTVATFLLQVTANLVNEYEDSKRGADEHKTAGQGMVIKEKRLSPASVRNGAVMTTAIAILIGLYLVSVSGWWLLVIGALGVCIAVAYTAGPFPLAYHGLGELAAGIFMGPMIVLGAYYAMYPQMTLGMVAYLTLVSIPVALLVAAILHANNIRDLDADRLVGKRTLAVRFGRRIAGQEYLVLVLGAYIVQAGLVLLGQIPAPTLLTYITLPMAYQLSILFTNSNDTQVLHAAQGQTARVHGIYGILMASGWLTSMAVSSVF
jgi:1,4-dihydroxy-2-naphthoate polyprenyltransferase